MRKPARRPWIESGTSRSMALVFACPGKDELEARRPAAGQTGENLEALLRILIDEWGVTQFRRRGEFTITNSWPGVLYDTLTVPPISWVKEEWNLLRLKGELSQIEDWIVCFGSAARKAALALRTRGWLLPSCQIICGYHPAFGAINRQIKLDLDDQPIPRQDESPGVTNQTYLRLEVVAACLLQQMGLGSNIRLHDGRAWVSQLSRLSKTHALNQSSSSA